MKTTALYDLLATKGLRPVDLAGSLNVDRATITRWAHGRIPAERAIDIEKATGIPRASLRPDLYAIEAAE